MFVIQAVVPATLVFVLFITAHLFVENEGSGIYLPDTLTPHFRQIDER